MFFFVCRWWRKNEWLRVISVKSFNIKVFVKNSTVGTVIYLLERIKSYVGYLQFMVEQEHNLVGHLILPWIFIVGQNVFFSFGRTIFDFGRTLSDVRQLF